MRQSFYFLLALLSLALTAVAQQKAQDNFQAPRTFHQDLTVSLDCQYLLFLPRDYETEPARRWPLILFLHGSGERGAEVWRTDIHGPSKYIAKHPDFPFILITPLCPSNEIWSAQLLSHLLDTAAAEYRVDTNRIYLTGLSMGGFGAWDLALAEPARFAAVIPIAGGGADILPVLTREGAARPEYIKALRSLAFWAFHGGKDTVVPPEDSEHMVAALKRAGVKEVKLTIYPEATHNSWAQTYDNPAIYEWLLQHKR
jgi:predicted peptidase